MCSPSPPPLLPGGVCSDLPTPTRLLRKLPAVSTIHKLTRAHKLVSNPGVGLICTLTDPLFTRTADQHPTVNLAETHLGFPSKPLLPSVSHLRKRSTSLPKSEQESSLGTGLREHQGWPHMKARGQWPAQRRHGPPCHFSTACPMRPFHLAVPQLYSFIRNWYLINKYNL